MIQTAAMTERDYAGAARAPLSLLLVEDSPADSRLLRESMRDATDTGELIVAVVRRLADAKAELARMRFDCALIDLGLPDGRGTANVEALAAMDPRVALIVLTGLDSDASALKALKLGAQDYLVKGQHDPVQLLKRIRLAVQRHRQVSALEAKNRSESHQARHDPLTGLPNRQAFEHGAAVQIVRAREDGTGCTLCFIDLDGFKLVNDRHGHAFGDRVLREVGRRFAACRRGAEMVARLGGDEFALLIPGDVDGLDPRHVAARYHEQLRGVASVEGRDVALSGSIGIARFPDHGDSLAALMQASDTAMYAAKRAGGGIRVSEAAAAGAEPMTAAEDVPPPAKPVTDAEPPVSVVFQPWIDTVTGRDLGVEALARWHEGTRTLRAEEFVCAAEQDGSIRAIGRAVIRKACAHWASLRADGIDPGDLALNVSTGELLEEDYPASLLGAVRDAGMEPRRLCLEVRGSTLLQPAAALVLTRLQDAGCRVVLDRFGEDVADLGLLSIVPLDGVKLDRSLLRRLAADGCDSAAGRLFVAILGAVAGLHVPAVVTGVETEAEVRLLASIGSRWQQGGWYAPAGSVDELVQRLRTRQAAAPASTGRTPP